MNSRIIDCLTKTLKSNKIVWNYSKYFMKTPVLPVPAQTVKYSTTTSVVKPMDIFDFFTDLVCEKPGKPSIPEPDSEMIPDNKQKSTSKVDNILADINTKNPYVTSKMLMSALTTGINTKNYSEVNKIINFCIDKQIPLPSALVSMIASKYSNIGLVESLATVQTLCKLTDEKEYYRKGEFLHHLALCYWIKGNCTRCIELLRECSSKYPSLNDTTKKVLKCVIPEAVSSRSQAQLVNITDFIKEFARRFGDFYPMTLLWNQLFLSCWYTDQELADQLLDSDENLQRCVSLLVPSLVPYLIKKNQVPDVYRFLQILLKYKFMDEYSTTLQILFDYYCFRNEKNRCAEIVKSSVQLEAPLREEQYNQFISWNVYGNPLKGIKKTEVAKIYSTF